MGNENGKNPKNGLTQKFRLCLNKGQEQKLLETLDKCRFVYNEMLSDLNKQKKQNKFELQSQLPKLKQKYPSLKGGYLKIL